MELQELRKTPHLSASAINDYLDCGLLYKFGRIDRIPASFTSDALEFGSAMHLTLADLHREKMIGNTMTIAELHDQFEHYWTRLAETRDDMEYTKGNTFESLLLQGKELLTVYHDKASWQDYECIAVEEAFSFTVDGCALPIIGAYDLVEKDSSGTIIITDFKTSARSYSIDEVDKNLQLTLYQMALKENGYHDSEILLRFDCLIKTKQPKFESYYTTRSDVDEIRARKKITAVYQAIEQGIFSPNDGPANWKCTHCAFKTHCDAWFLREDAA